VFCASSGGDAVEGFREVMQFRVRQDKGTAPSHLALWPMMVVIVNGGWLLMMVVICLVLAPHD
jgi:hypothetical protein